MPEAESRRYLAVIELRKDTPLTEIGQRMAAIHGLLKRFSNNDAELAFASADARLFGVLFKAPTPVLVIRAELDKMTVNGDKFLVFEAGDLAAEKGLGRPATWLQRR
jgi:hypothetical protein